MTRARVQTFHIDSHEVLDLFEALDGVAEMFAHHADFGGLVCLTRDSVRKEIIVITLWEGEGLDVTQKGSELARERIAATTDLGVSTKCYEVLRLVPGESVLGDDSDILGQWARSGPRRPAMR